MHTKQPNKIEMKNQEEMSGGAMTFHRFFIGWYVRWLGIGFCTGNGEELANTMVNWTNVYLKLTSPGFTVTPTKLSFTQWKYNYFCIIDEIYNFNIAVKNSYKVQIPYFSSYSS